MRRVITEIEGIVRCPRCGGRDVRHSRHRGIKDAFLVALGRHPFRCRACDFRFYKSLPREAGGQTADNPIGSNNTKVV